MHSHKGARLIHVNVKTHDMRFASNLEKGKSILVIFCKAIVSKPIWGQVYWHLGVFKTHEYTNWGNKDGFMCNLRHKQLCIWGFLVGLVHNLTYWNPIPTCTIN